MQRIQRYAALFISIIITATAILVDSLFTWVKEPYHTSILTGEGWIMELLSGYPNHIWCELELISKSGPQTNQNWPTLLHCDGAMPMELVRLKIAVDVNVDPRFLVEAKISKIFKITEI